MSLSITQQHNMNQKDSTIVGTKTNIHTEKTIFEQQTVFYFVTAIELITSPAFEFGISSRDKTNNLAAPTKQPKQAAVRGKLNLLFSIHSALHSCSTTVFVSTLYSMHHPP